MFTLITLAICVPLVAVAAHFVFDDKCPQFFADVRGIALQTVIIIVVLLAIAGAIAGVLVSRGDEAADTLESQEIVTDPDAQAALYRTISSCQAAGFTWDASATPPCTP